MPKALIIAPCFEIATQEWYPWLVYYLAPQLKARGVEPVLVQGDKATRENVWKLLTDEEIRAILGVGHGNDNVYTGQNYDEIFVSCQYPSETIRNRCFAPVSCLVGRGLLPDMVEKGLGCGLGEITVYVFYFQPGVDPLQDWVLALFTKSEFVYAISLAEGKTSGEAHAAMIKAYYDAADKIRDIDPEIAYTLQVHLPLVRVEHRRAPPDEGPHLEHAYMARATALLATEVHTEDFRVPYQEVTR